MQKAIIGFSASLFFGCAPSLSDREGARCDEARACGEGLSCYRGFCLPDSEPSTESTTSVDEDAGAGPNSNQHAPDAGVRSGGSSQSPATDAAVAGTNSTPPGAEPASTAKPEPTPKPEPKPKPNETPSPAPVDAGVISAADAGALPALDAGPLPVADASPLAAADAFVLPENCTLNECCEEAQRDDDEKEPKRGKSCGCDDAQLLSTLICTVL